MGETTGRRDGARAWWLAFAAVALCGPWPGWEPPLPLLLAGAVLLAVVARPRRDALAAWLAAALALAGAVAMRPRPAPTAAELEAQLAAHTREMLELATRLRESPALSRLLGASGEVLDPEVPFRLLENAVGRRPGRTAYLADDRGRLVAWGGASRWFPASLRPLGQRQWAVAWSAGGATLAVREPLLQEGRLLGAITVADHAPLDPVSAWGLRVPPGYAMRLAAPDAAGGGLRLAPAGAPGVELAVEVVTAPRRPFLVAWLAWLVAVMATAAWRPRWAWAPLAGGLLAAGVNGVTATEPAASIAVLAVAGVVARSAAVLPRAAGRGVILASAVAGVTAALGPAALALGSWLPAHLLRPGRGGVWIVATAWLVAAWPGLRRTGGLGLAQRLVLAVGIAVAAVALQVAGFVVELAQPANPRPLPPASLGNVDLETVLPAPVGECGLADLAAVLAERWRLGRRFAPAQLRVLAADGSELSRWGDLTPAGDAVELVTRREIHSDPVIVLELWAATRPWRLLDDWFSGEPSGEVAERAEWSAVFDRAGAVAATLHPEVTALDPSVAGSLFYAGSGWRWLEVGDLRLPARLRRDGDLLVAAMVRSPPPSVWVVQGAVACVWALLGSLLALPPVLRREAVTTFGGRLRLLVAGGIVLPLVILTLFLHLRLRREEDRLEQLTGLEGLRSARYATTHLAGGVAVDDELARWLAQGWGGEVALFDGVEPVAVSRPDLMHMGVLPQLPAAAAYPGYLIGRDTAVVRRLPRRIISAAPVSFGGRRLMLQLYRADPVRAQRGPNAVDWLLTGAVLAALVTLVLTTRIEARLSASLKELVALARRLLHGERAEPVRRPPETDLAEVLDAVQSMSEEVQQREQVLRHQEELLRITLATLGPAVLVLDRDRRRRFENPSAVRLQEEHGELLERLLVELAARDWRGTGAHEETVRPVPGRDLTWRVGLAGVPLPAAADGDGEGGLVVVIDDVSEVVRADRLRQLAQLARIVAHEVKNPLTPIRLWVQEVEEAHRRGSAELATVVGEACREIGRQVERLQATASSFSNLVALERWEAERIDVAEVIAECVAGLGVLARRGISLQVEVEDGPPMWVVGDRHWLRRALDNLIKNSVDALGDEGGGIVVSLRRRETAVELAVEDTAGGVPESQLKDLFSPRFSTTTAGSGLGLALVGQIVDRFEGEVAASNGTRGLLVQMRLPGVR